ncbi:MAG: hypothetical protein AB8E82_16665, partial [Aureispira sp.]
MTKQLCSLLLTTVACLLTQMAVAQNSNTQYDDLYFDGVEETPSYTAANNQAPEAVNTQNEVYDDEISTTESIQQNTRSYENYAQEQGNADPYDYQYSSRIRRFHNPAPGFSYYSNYYVDNYWYEPYAANYYGTSIYIGPSIGWNRWNRWNRWDRRNRWNDPWAWNNSWNNPYCGGWNNSWGWRNNFNNGGGWNNGWNNGWNTGYNYVASTPNAANFTNSIRGVRGASVSRANGQHVASNPRGRSNTSNVGNVRATRGNGRSGTTTTGSGYNNTRVTTNGNRTTIVRERNDDPRRSYNNSNTTNTRSNSSRGSYTPNTRTNAG